MSNPKFGVIDATTVQKHIRLAKSIEDGMTLTLAYEIASRAMGGGSDLHPCGHYVDDLNMVRPIPRSTPVVEKPVTTLNITEHREKVHTFNDGTVLKSCAASSCFWGKPNPATGTIVKTHSDGAQGGVIYSSEALDAGTDEGVEASPDDVQELDLFSHNRAPVAGEDSLVEETCEEDIAVEQVVEDAATEDEDEYAD
jgi:hypothetical protein